MSGDHWDGLKAFSNLKQCLSIWCDRYNSECAVCANSIVLHREDDFASGKEKERIETEILLVNGVTEDIFLIFGFG